MYRADISLIAFKYIGIWPQKSSKVIFATYSTFSIFMFFFAYAFTFANVMYLFQNLNMEEFTESLFYVLALIVASNKMAVVFIKHRKIFEITDMLHRKEYEPRDFAEYRIQEKYDKIGSLIVNFPFWGKSFMWGKVAHWTISASKDFGEHWWTTLPQIGTIIFIIGVFITVIIKASIPLVKNDGTLPYKVWVPYSLENRTSYWLTYLYHFAASMIAGQTTVAGDTFAIVMMLQLCAQLDILKHRIQKFPQLCMREFSNNPKKEERFLGMWIQHHNSLYLFGSKLNDIYSSIFFIQLFATTIDVCTCTYLLATLSVTSVKFWSMIFSLICVMFQICLYCWHGNMLMERSTTIGFAAYSISWFLLSKSSRRNIIHIIRRSTKPITFTAGSIVPLSINTFNSILRLSYSIYNCLMKSS